MADDQAVVDARAFEAATEDLAGATTSYGALGETFDIKAALDATPDKGLIVVDANADPSLAEALYNHSALRPVESVPKAAQDRLQKEANAALAKADDQPEALLTGADSVAAAEAEGQTVRPDTPVPDETSVAAETTAPTTDTVETDN